MHDCFSLLKSIVKISCSALKVCSDLKYSLHSLQKINLIFAGEKNNIKKKQTGLNMDSSEQRIFLFL